FAIMVAPSPRVPIKEDAGQDGRASVPSSRHTASPLRPVLGLFLALADGTLLAQPGVPTRLAGLFVMSPLPGFFGEPAALQQFLEAAEGQADWLGVVDAHSQRHRRSLTIC